MAKNKLRDRIIKIVRRDPGAGESRAVYLASDGTFTRLRHFARIYGDYPAARADMITDAYKLKQPGRIVRCVCFYSSPRELPDANGFRQMFPKVRR